MTALAYIPFLQPLPALPGWLIMIVPVAIAVAFAHKALRLDDLSKAPYEALWVAGQIVGVMAAAAFALYLLGLFV